MALGTELHSMRPSAARAGLAAASAQNTSAANVNAARRRKFARTRLLFIAQSFDRIEASGAGGGIESSKEADDNREGNRAEREPQWHGGDLHGRQTAAREINVGAKGERAADKPADEDSADAAEQAHHARFGEEKLFDVAIIGAERFENADFAAALENGHHQRVDDAESGDGERETAENSEKQIDDSEEEAEIARCIEQRKSFEAHVFDGGFGGLHIRGTLHTHGEARIVARSGGTADELLKITNAGGAQVFGDVERNENAATAESAETAFGLGVDNSDDAQGLFFGDDGEAAWGGIRIHGAFGCA